MRQLKIGIRLLVLLLGLFLLWKGEATTMWFAIGLTYLLLSIIGLFLLSRKIESGKKSQGKE